MANTWQPQSGQRYPARQDVGRPRAGDSQGRTQRQPGLPKDFVIAYANDEAQHTCNPADPRFKELGNWVPLLSYFGYPQPGNAALNFKFPTGQITCLRILGTELSQDDYGYRYLQFNELEYITQHAALAVRRRGVIADQRMAGDAAD